LEVCAGETGLEGCSGETGTEGCAGETGLEGSSGETGFKGCSGETWLETGLETPGWVAVTVTGTVNCEVEAIRVI
jgi:hypothetical protein